VPINLDCIVLKIAFDVTLTLQRFGIGSVGIDDSCKQKYGFITDKDTTSN
jgi:hypothetical protein